MNPEIIKKIAEYGDKYIEKHLIEFDKDLLIKDWYKALLFLFCHSFYQGRRDNISEEVKKRAVAVLEKYYKNDERLLLNEENFSQIRTELNEVIGKGKIGKGRDIDMVIDILKFISKLKGGNIVGYSKSKIEEGEIKEHFNELQEIVSIGPKIASFYLRDLICLYSLSIDEENEVFLQPVDTWVRQVANKIEIIGENDDDQLVRENIVKACLLSKVSPIKFNQGAWFVGTNSFEILLNNIEKI